VVSFVSSLDSDSNSVVGVGVRSEDLGDLSEDCSSAARPSSRVGLGAWGLSLCLEGISTAMTAPWALGCLLGRAAAGLVTLVVVRKLRVCCCWEGVWDARVDERRVVGGIVRLCFLENPSEIGM